MYYRLTVVLYVVAVTVQCVMGRDCQDEVTFRSNISMESWCKTDIDSCSLGTLKSRFATLFNATGWAPGKPSNLNVTSYCQTDSNGLNQAGINITWSPPNHSGARDIKGFELRVEGYHPGYKCSIMKLNENITKSMTQIVYDASKQHFLSCSWTKNIRSMILVYEAGDYLVIPSEIMASIYPVERHKNFIISLFSLPRSDDSTQVTHSLHTPKCERENTSWSSYDVDFSMLYDSESKELNVSFTGPPVHLNISEFTMTIIGINVQAFSRVRINQTFHVFKNIEAGKYRIMVTPFNPRPHDEKQCKCRDDRNRCMLCSNIAKDIGITQKPKMKTSQTPTRTKTKWTTKIVIKNVTGKRKNKNKKWKKEAKQQKKETRRLINVLLPVALAIVCVVFIIVIIVLCKRRRSQRRFYNSDKRAGSATSSIPGYLICFEEHNSDKQTTNQSVMQDSIEIFKGVLGNNVNIQRFGYRHTSDLNSQLYLCLQKITGRRNKSGSERSSDDKECSETCLVDKKINGKQQSKLTGSLHGKLPVNIDCCLRHTNKESVIVICIFGHRYTGVDVFDACQNVCDDTSNEILECLGICVYPNQNDMPVSMCNFKAFSYKDQLPQLLDFLKDAFLRPKDLSDPKKSEVTFVTNGDTDSMKEMDKYVRMSACKDSGDCWVELPEGIQISNGPWMEMAKRKRYMSNDSGWGASENSFRSTPVEEEKETSPESSLQFDLESEQDCQSPYKESLNSFLPRNLSYIHQKHPALTRLQYTHPLMKCPSEISFFPPEEIHNSSDNISAITDSVQATNKQLGEYVDKKNITQVETVPCNNNMNETVSCKNHMDRHVLGKKEKRKSASMDTLMDILKDINDQSTFYIEHEADVGEVHSVFEGTA